MSGLLRRIRGARAAAPDPAPDEGAARSTEGGTVHVHYEATDPGGPPPLPAGTDLDRLVGDRPTTRRRGRLRRRLRHLRRVREVLLRDLGGLVFEVHRSARASEPAQSQVVRGKLERLEQVSTEIHELEQVLDDRRGMVVREPGIGGTCPSCGELYGSAARFCWACGTPVAPGATRAPIVAAPEALPVLGAAAKEGTPSHEWHAPEPAPEPHIEGSGEELAPEVPPEGSAGGAGAATDGATAPATDDAAATAGEPSAAEVPATSGEATATTGEATTAPEEQATVERTRVHDARDVPELRDGDPLMERRG